MTTNANKGHRRFGTARTTKSSRNGGRGHVRQIDSLRTRYREWGTDAATATIQGTDALEDENGTVFSVINTSGDTITFTTNSGANYNQAPTKVSTHAWTFGTALATTAAKATQALHIALEAARVDGELDMTLTPASYTSEASFVLTQDAGGVSGSSTIVAPTGIHVNYAATTAATATIHGTAALLDTDETVFSVINATDGQTITFTTDSGANYNQAPTKASTYAWTFGTALANTAAKATQALHIALEAARTDGALKMTLTPSSYTSESSFVLTQVTLGTSGNSAIVAPAGVRVNLGASAADGEFSGGTDGAFSGGTAKIKTAERLFEPGLNFGGSLGTTYEGSTIGRTNTSVGDKDLIRDSAA
jgi:hypothetical protein